MNKIKIRKFSIIVGILCVTGAFIFIFFLQINNVIVINNASDGEITVQKIQTIGINLLSGPEYIEKNPTPEKYTSLGRRFVYLNPFRSLPITINNLLKREENFIISGYYNYKNYFSVSCSIKKRQVMSSASQ